MSRPYKSRSSDITSESSPISDTSSLSQILRAARSKSHLSQAELAGRLGLRQRQISDLERAAMDPRLSTIQNVARALDLELMLIPRHLIAAVHALQRSGSDLSRRPLYALSDEDTLTDADEPPPELGDGSESTGQTDRQSRSRRRKQ